MELGVRKKTAGRGIMRRTVLFIIMLAGIAFCHTAGFAESDSGCPSRIPEGILRYELVEVDHVVLKSALDSGGAITLMLFGEDHQLKLRRRELRSPIYRAVAVRDQGVMAIAPSSFATYKGSVDGVQDSKVRLGIGERGISGFILIPPDLVFIEPLWVYVREAAPTSHLVYRSSDIDKAIEAGICGVVDALVAPPCEECTPLNGDSRSVRVAEIATDADYEYYQQYGAGTNDWILSILNQIEGIYEDDLEVTFSVTYQNVWTTNDDPYTTTDPVDLLVDEFRPWWNANMGSVTRDLAHLFTGKNLDGNVIGIAYQSVVCNISWAYGLSQDLWSNHFRVLVTAHEMGHNFGGTHAAANSSPPTIMYPTLSDATVWQFSDGNITNIGNYIDTWGGCLSLLPIPSPVSDLAIILLSPATLELDWTVVPEISYRVYRGTDAYFLSPTPVADDVVPPWNDTPTGPEESHYYYVRGLNLAGEGDPSNRVGASDFDLP